jgi:hypothetical protein
VDQGEPPRIVFEEPSPCPDVPRAEGTLRRTLDPSRAPTAGWTITLRIIRANGALQADGEITDATHAPVAHRIFTHVKDECASLARAVGVWASIVLDTELDRVRDEPPPSPPRATPAPAVVDASDTPLDRADETRYEKDDRTLELGGTAFLLGGMGTTAVAGVSLYTMVQIGGTVFMRPALSYGSAVRGVDGPSGVGATWGGARFDFCTRLVGAHLDSRALRVDACFGAEVGFVHVDAGPYDGIYMSTPEFTVPTLDLAPSMALSGDLNSFLSVELRGFGFVNTLPGHLAVQPALLGGRVELALAWQFR